MDEVTQQNVALVEEAAAASASLQDQATDLAQVVSIFKLDTGQVALSPASVPQTASRAPLREDRSQGLATPRTAIAADGPANIAHITPDTRAIGRNADPRPVGRPA